MMPVQDLRGPNADEACHLLGKALALTTEQAQQISDLYEADNHPAYTDHCREVWNALENTGRVLPLGWFEAIFADCSWVESTKALHAIADAVMATIVRQEISRAAYSALTLPFVAGRVQQMVDADRAKVDLNNEFLALTSLA